MTRLRPGGAGLRYGRHGAEDRGQRLGLRSQVSGKVGQKTEDRQ